MSGWDNASLIAGEVKDPGKTYFPAVMFSVALCGLVYFLTMLVRRRAPTAWRQPRIPG